MSLSAKQVGELEKPLDRSKVAERTQSGRTLSYIEGWHAIAEANRIFGFDGWQRETIEMREVRPIELVSGANGKKTWRVGFICKVRITVGSIVREGTGYGSGALPEQGEAYESAVKEAETDAMKRALMTFGNPFGLALYDKKQANVTDGEAADAPETAADNALTPEVEALMARIKKAIDAAKTIPVLQKIRNGMDATPPEQLPNVVFNDLAKILDDKAALIAPPKDEDPFAPTIDPKATLDQQFGAAA